MAVPWNRWGPRLAAALGGCAQRHEEEAGPGYGLGDLQEILAAAFDLIDGDTARRILQHEQARAVLELPEYRELYEAFFDEEGNWIGW